MVFFGCGTVLLTFLVRSLLGRLPHFGGVAVLVSAVHTHPSVVGLSGSGAVSSLGNIDNGGRRKIRLTKKTNVCKRFGVDPWRAANFQTLEG